MRVDIYLNYGGQCEEAFRFYEKHLGAKVTMMMKHGEAPDQANVPAHWKNAVLHAQLEFGNAVIMGADVLDRHQPMRSAYVSLTADSVAEADRVYAVLTDGGEVFMKMEETFFAKRFAMFRDRFGTSWMLLHAPAERQKSG
jgi:PhnB protein